MRALTVLSSPSAAFRRVPRSFNAVDANARLTAVMGLVLLVLLPVEGVTLLSLRSLLTVHMLVGVALIPPIALKLASTGYRFMPASSSGSAPPRSVFAGRFTGFSFHLTPELLVWDATRLLNLTP